MLKSQNDLANLFQMLIEAEKVKCVALRAHASSPTEDNLKTLVNAAVDYLEAKFAIEAALDAGELRKAS